MEETLRRFHNEDTDLHREIHALHTEKTTAVRRAEEQGYAKGLEDARKHPGELGLMPMSEQPYQQRVNAWMHKCFDLHTCTDTMERNHRFLEEAIELVQSLGCTPSEAHQLVDYVFGRPVGHAPQEVGGVRVTLSALCTAAGIQEDAEAERELERINQPEMITKIRTKHAAKPKHSPLPGWSDQKPAGRILTCVYCGHEYPQDTPAHGSKVLTDHISQCEKHPMREVIDQRDKLKSAMAGLIGVSDSAELRSMESIIRLSPAPAADKAAMLDAIHVLLNVTEQQTGLTMPQPPGGGDGR